MDSVFIDENTFMKCGEVFRNKNGKHQYQCFHCELFLEKATELERHASIHFKFLLQAISNETPTASVPENAENESAVPFKYEPESDEVFPIGMEMVIEDELANLDSIELPNETLSVNSPDKTAALEIALQIRTKDLQSHERLHPIIKNTYKCSRCTEEFPNYEKATHHITNHCKEESLYNVEKRDSDVDFVITKPYKFEFADTKGVLPCSICPMTFHSNDELAAHIVNHNETISSTAIGYKIEMVDSLEIPTDGEKKKTKGPYFCSTCGRKFRYRLALDAHINMHYGIRPYKCDQCSKTFRSPSYLKEHLFIHSDLRQFECATCSKTFKSKGNLRGHLVTHLRPAVDVPKRERKRDRTRKIRRKYLGSCNICGKVINVSAMKIHMRSHTGERPYKCTLCPKTYIQNAHLADHMQLHAGIRSKQCNVCPKAFITTYQLRRHQKRHLRQSNGTALQKPKTKRIDPCYICGLSVAEMHKHLKTHEPPTRPHKCEICEKTYTSSTYLKAHKRAVHSDERPFACHLCPKTFKTKSNRAAHFRFHNGTVKTYQCYLCEYVGNDKETVNIHVRVRHTGEKPFGCDHCDMKFASKKTRKQHETLHLGEKQFQCRYCDKTFAQNAGRRSHERRVHEAH